MSTLSHEGANGLSFPLQSIVDLVDDMGWKTFTIVYEDDDGLFRLQDVLKAHGPQDSPVTVRRLGPGPDYR